MNRITNSFMYLNELLLECKAAKERYEQELREAPAGTLGIRRVNNKNSEFNYCRYVGRKRYGIEKDPDLAEKLARKKYLEKTLEIIKNNILCLEQLLNEYMKFDHQEIINSFPHHYGTLMDKEQAEWNLRKHQWQADIYNQSTYKPQEKTHVTAGGLHVRSKSEVIVAERLDYYGIPYRYEQMLYIEQYDFAPDFTILTRKGLMYWEHCGMMDDPGYVSRQIWKSKMYAKIGIVPWKNLIITYDDEDGNFDSRIIESEIINKLLPYC